MATKLISRYIQTIRNIPRVGGYLALFIRFLVDMGADSSQIHLIGFSLGADVAGHAGKTVKQWNIEIERITGI